MWPFKMKPNLEPDGRSTISSEALDYEDELREELGHRMNRMFDWTNRVEHTEVKRAFIEVCREMADELDTP